MKNTLNLLFLIVFFAIWCFAFKIKNPVMMALSACMVWHCVAKILANKKVENENSD